ncbi:MAG: D-tyrosyl-tRNA(Tyr) deacylase [Caldisericia bacterium]|nr:D-tyrosyl-tRNA(Tyr) deacylase [Caldisericia bacterium]
MRVVVQRVLGASVKVDGSVISEIQKGLLVLVCVVDGDDEKDIEYIVRKILGLRIFPDENGKMNWDISRVSGSILLVSQFTLAGDVRRGNRPDFMTASQPDVAKKMVDEVACRIENIGINVEQGEFGADMKVTLTNDGPVTILLDSKKVF